MWKGMFSDLLGVRWVEVDAERLIVIIMPSLYDKSVSSSKCDERLWPKLRQRDWPIAVRRR